MFTIRYEKYPNTNYKINDDININKDVSSVIGPPNGVNYKSEELFKLGISENLQSIGNLSQYNDYFYNFITLGLVRYFNTNFPLKFPLIYLSFLSKTGCSL